MFEKIKIGNEYIEVAEKVDDKTVSKISNEVAQRLLIAFPDYKLNYLDIYEILLDTPMYYAKIPEGLSKANYYYKNSSIYFDKDINLTKMNEFILHECIHRLQERKDRRGNITRLGVCEVNELSVKAAALNEGAIQYITSKAFDLPLKMVTVYDITMPSKTTYYPIITNIVTQLAFLLGEEILVDSTINGNEEFKIEIIDNIGENEYNIIEKNLNEILKLKNDVTEARKSEDITSAMKQTIDIKKDIKNIYFETQKIIFTSYFNDLLKRSENELEVEMIISKLNSYMSLTGTYEDYNDFKDFYEEFYNRSVLKIEDLKRRKALVKINDNLIYRIFRRIKKILFTNSTKEYYK